ncbi:MAE-28990/MAE-18760-like HEPN domain-containing protein [Vibrio crassostreae]|nr:MAE-28990/MAE-18760-like HEPN domain-containing protein [Vibrio crassostreae]
MKIRTAYQLEQQLDADLAWRKREFTTLKLMVKSSRNHEQKVLFRASIALLYSHWEGHIKHCALIYLRYLNHLAHNYDQMTDNFTQISLGDTFKQGFSIKKFNSQKSVFEYLAEKRSESFSIDEDIVVNTESNLKYEVVFNILGQLGLDTSTFELKEHFINSKLLRCRNAIAHGDRVNDEDLADTYTELESELLGMIETFQSLIRNAVDSKSYLKDAL